MSKVITTKDHPNWVVQRERSGTVAAAGASFAHFHFFQTVRIRAVHAVVLTAGTATETPAYALRVDKFGPAGTTSFANLAYGTNTAMHIVHQVAVTTIAADNGIRFTKGTEAVGVVMPYFEYEVLDTASMS